MTLCVFLACMAFIRSTCFYISMPFCVYMHNASVIADRSSSHSLVSCLNFKFAHEITAMHMGADNCNCRVSIYHIRNGGEIQLLDMCCSKEYRTNEMGFRISLVPRPSLTAFFAAVEKSVGFLHGSLENCRKRAIGWGGSVPLAWNTVHFQMTL